MYGVRVCAERDGYVLPGLAFGELLDLSDHLRDGGDLLGGLLLVRPH